MRSVTVFLLLSTLMFAQEKPKEHGLEFAVMVDGPAEIQIGAGYVSVTGSWKALDERSALSGPSVSELLCDKAEKACHESQANISVIGNEFALTADSVDYKITRWDSKEIVAQNISGICRVLHTLKVDLQNKKVYALDSLSEAAEDLPKISKDVCNAVGMRLELRGATTYSVQ